MFEPNVLGCRSVSFSFIESRWLCMAGGNPPLVLVSFPYAQEHLSSKLWKYSVGSGMSLGVGANFKPSCRALV